MATHKMSVAEAQQIVARQREDDATVAAAEEVLAAERRRQASERVERAQRERRESQVTGLRRVVEACVEAHAAFTKAKRAAPRAFERSLLVVGAIPHLTTRGTVLLPLGTVVAGLPAAAEALRERLERLRSEKD